MDERATALRKLGSHIMDTLDIGWYISDGQLPEINWKSILAPDPSNRITITI